MAITYKALAKVTVGSTPVSTIEFTSIPQSYTDLKVVLSPRTTVDCAIALRFNSNTANYSGKVLRGDGSVVATYLVTDYGAFTSTAMGLGYIKNATSTFAIGEIYITNYTGSTHKMVGIENMEEKNQASPVYATMTAGLWANTSAITSITFILDSSTTFQQYSTATLYGINNS
jgi:hypothetical protein